MIEVLLYSLVLGCAYALMAAGFNLLLGVARVINLAYGAHMVLVAYVYSTAHIYLKSTYLAIAAALALSVVLGLLLWPLFRVFGKNEVLMVVSSLALALLIEGILHRVYGPTQLVVPPFTDLTLGYVSGQWMVTVALSVVTLLTYYLVINYTGIGKRIVAVSENDELATLMGINVKLVQAISFLLASLFAALASLALSPIYSITPHSGWLFLIMALAVSIIGGLGSVGGSVAAAFVMSFAERLSVYYLGPTTQYLVPLVLLIFVLLLRPRGILGRGGLRWA